MEINTHYIKELLILCMGPIFQVLAYYLLLLFFKDKELVRTYHLGILGFNLLPIYPLDGGKLCNLLFNFLLPYKISLKISILLSYLLTVILFFSKNELKINMIITYILLLSMIRKEDLKRNLYFHKFLLERYLNNYSYKKEVKIKKLNQFYRYRKNKIKEKNNWIDEKDYLRKKYENFKKNC